MANENEPKKSNGEPRTIYTDPVHSYLKSQLDHQILVSIDLADQIRTMVAQRESMDQQIKERDARIQALEDRLVGAAEAPPETEEDDEHPLPN
jgi:hypothetical protein